MKTENNHHIVVNRIMMQSIEALFLADDRAEFICAEFGELV